MSREEKKSVWQKKKKKEHRISKKRGLRKIGKRIYFRGPRKGWRSKRKVEKYVSQVLNGFREKKKRKRFDLSIPHYSRIFTFSEQVREFRIKTEKGKIKKI